MVLNLQIIMVTTNARRPNIRRDVGSGFEILVECRVRSSGSRVFLENSLAVVGAGVRGGFS